MVYVLNSNTSTTSPRTDWFRLKRKNGSSNFIRPGKLSDTTANVSSSITTMASDHNHQSRFSSFRRVAWISCIRLSGASSGNVWGIVVMERSISQGPGGARVDPASAIIIGLKTRQEKKGGCLLSDRNHSSVGFAELLLGGSGVEGLRAGSVAGLGRNSAGAPTRPFTALHGLDEMVCFSSGPRDAIAVGDR